MKTFRIGLVFLLTMTVLLTAAKGPVTVARKVLFDFMKSPKETEAMLQKWKTVEWTPGKANRPVLTVQPDGGFRMELQPKNLNTGEYEAPNIQFDFDAPQDWSGFNFLVIRMLNPTEETNTLRIDLYCPGKYAVQNCPVPPGRWYDLRVPMSGFINFRNPLDPKQVTAISLLRRDLTRMIPFTIASIALEKVVPPEQRTSFPGLQAWFFPGSANIAKPGFQAIAADDPRWSGGKVTVASDKAFEPSAWDALWKGQARGRELSVLNLPVPKPGRYQAALLFRGGGPLTDTFVKLGDSRFYRHIMGSPYAELRMITATASGNTLPLTLKKGRPEADWAISAVMLYPEESAQDILEQFVYPCLDDMTVAIRDDRVLSKDETVIPALPVAGYDIYKEVFTPALETSGNELFVSVMADSYRPAVVVTLENLKDGSGKALPASAAVLKSVMEYTAAYGEGYRRIPRFCKMMLEREVPLRKGFPNWFMIEGTGQNPGTVCGELVMTEGSRKDRYPFQLTARGKMPSDDDVDYFLWYYASNGGQEYEEFKLLREYGFHALEFPILNGKITRNPDDTFSYNMAPMVDYMRRFMKRSGLRGPIPMYLYNPLRTVNGMLENKTFISNGPNLSKSVSAMVELVRVTEELRKKEGWPEFLYYLFDEVPDVPMGKVYHKAIRALGAPVFTTSVGSYGNVGIPSKEDEIDVYCYPNCPTQNHAAVKAAIEAQGGRYWGYSVDSGNALAARFNWGLKVWHLGMTGYGAWHFGGSAAVSALISGGYRYGVAFYGPGRMMTTPSLFAIAQAMEDRRALKALEEANPASPLLKRFHEAAEKLLRVQPQVLSQWYQAEGEAMYRSLHQRGE